MAEQNKVTFGLQDVHWAEVTKEGSDGTLTYGAVERLRGAAELTLDPTGDSGSYKADNINYYTAESNDGYTGTLKVASLTQEFLTRVLGETIDSTSKVVTELASSEKKYFALMFRFEGDKKETLHVLYYCYASRPKLGSKTKSGSDINEVELNFTASPRPLDKVVRRRTTEDTPDEVRNNWFNKVYEPTANGGRT
ncbi:major tail protein [Streptococcus suis]|uniref:major tail protein n=1 Tax=Streptococcus suis TaxID=1307 RepID=UPI000CF58667|nr:major tail protein [Streptococcus suis]